MARIDSAVITTQTSTQIYSPSSRPDNNTHELVRIYAFAVPSTGGWNGATATLYSSPDGGVTKIAEKDRLGNPVVFTHVDGYFDLNVMCRPSSVVQAPITYWLTTTVANPTGIKAIIFDIN